MPSAMPPTDKPLPLSPTPIKSVTSPSNHARRASLKVLSRNIDQVVLGNLLFRTWYYSPYPDSIILGDEHAVSHTGSTAAAKQHTHVHAASKVNGAPDSIAGTSSQSTPCERLHVCPYCFRYTPNAVHYAQHLQRHNVTYDPWTRQMDENDNSSGRQASPRSDVSEDASTWPLPESAVKVYEYGGYAVWDVDGEREKLYCQNLSLFGKLFLEQKSVFFDTGGFHYFVLTYTPPPPPASPNATPKKASTAARNAARRRSSSTKSRAARAEDDPVPLPDDLNLRTQVLGFFSKENLSWDANNLACILVFPPYQHRSLGQLLMAVSYKLSGWEWEGSIIGGPEKPLSAMGRKSYLRFWSERVARFMMSQSADADGRRVFDGVRRRKKVGFHREEMTVKELGDRTGMLAEDVVAALNEMGVLEVVPPKKKKRKSDGEEISEDVMLSSMIVHRSKVLEWVEGRGVDLVSPVKEEGFLGEWALSEVEDEEEEDDEDGEAGEDEVEGSE